LQFIYNRFSPSGTSARLGIRLQTYASPPVVVAGL
jgi:hypothetical protein